MEYIHLSVDRIFHSYQDFLDRGLLLTRKLLNQEFLLVKSSLRKFYGHHHDLIGRYGISVSQMTTDMFHLSRRVAIRTQKRSCVHIKNFDKNENMVNLGHKVE